jgi:hypothetical protein
MQSQLQKRQSSVAAALLGALANTLSSIGREPPKATVAAVQDGPSPVHPEARRKKIRYGPYRIPPVSVSLQWSYQPRSIYSISSGTKHRGTNAPTARDDKHIFRGLEETLRKGVYDSRHQRQPRICRWEASSEQCNRRKHYPSIALILFSRSNGHRLGYTTLSFSTSVSMSKTLPAEEF